MAAASETGFLSQNHSVVWGAPPAAVEVAREGAGLAGQMELQVEVEHVAEGVGADLADGGGGDLGEDGGLELLAEGGASARRAVREQQPHRYQLQHLC